MRAPHPVVRAIVPSPATIRAALAVEIKILIIAAVVSRVVRNYGKLLKNRRESRVSIEVNGLK